ncbi:MAG: ABC transporter permease [Bryobacteraceae bacterium]|jgi:ABC-2 type transport system permease protein
MNFLRLRAVARKEFLHILRDPRSLILALAVPLLMLLMFGWALTLDVDRIPAYVYDWDGTPQSRALIDQFRGSRYFDIQRYVHGYAPVDKEVDRSRILMAIVVPKDYSRNILEGREADIQVILDGSDSNTASIALGYAQGVVAAYAAELRSEAQVRLGAGKLKVAVDPRVRVLYNSDLKSKNFIVPGLIAVTMMIIASLLTSLTVAREWETGTMEQLLSTPLRPAEIILGKLSAFFTLGFTDMLICVLVGVFVFHVPFRGSVWFLFFSSFLFLFGALCWGILISTLARSQLIAYQIGILTSFLPAFLLSGFIYSIENMPAVIQAVTYLVPARYFVTILKGVFLKGVGIEILAAETAFLFVYASLAFFLATKKMRQKVA